MGYHVVRAGEHSYEFVVFIYGAPPIQEGADFFEDTEP